MFQGEGTGAGLVSYRAKHDQGGGTEGVYEKVGWGTEGKDKGQGVRGARKS